MKSMYRGAGAHHKEISEHRGKIANKRGLPRKSDPHIDGGKHQAGVFDFPWGASRKPVNLIAFNEPKGQWTFPKKGVIQWRKTK